MSFAISNNEQLARKISRAKWDPKAGLTADEIPADAVTADLRTQDNALSFWACGSGDTRELDEVVLLQWVPVPERLDTSPFTKLKLWIDRETLLPDKVWYEDYNGDRVTITLLDPVLNRPIEKETFEAARIFPAGVEVIDRSPVR